MRRSGVVGGRMGPGGLSGEATTGIGVGIDVSIYAYMENSLSSCCCCRRLNSRACAVPLCCAALCACRYLARSTPFYLALSRSLYLARSIPRYPAPLSSISPHHLLLLLSRRPS